MAKGPLENIGMCVEMRPELRQRGHEHDVRVSVFVYRGSSQREMGIWP